jgi:hypothetical protein
MKPTSKINRRGVRTINKHLYAIFADGEVATAATTLKSQPASRMFPIRGTCLDISLIMGTLCVL